MNIEMNLQKDNWTAEDYSEFVKYLKTFADEQYRRFHHSLIPDSEIHTFIGVRMPKMRELGKEIAKGNPRSFLAVCKSGFYEERMMRGIVTGLVKPKDFDELCSLCEDFVPYVNNWALCDCFCSGLKAVKKYKSRFFDFICDRLCVMGNAWAVRVAIVLMLDYYLEDEYIDEVLMLVDGCRYEDYYVKMAQAWLIATAFAKCREKTLAYFVNEATVFDDVYNMAIQKAVESRRIDDETKAYLRTLKKTGDLYTSNTPPNADGFSVVAVGVQVIEKKKAT